MSEESFVKGSDMDMDLAVFREYLFQALKPYIEFTKEFYLNYFDYVFHSGEPVLLKKGPPQTFCKFNQSTKSSCIRGLNTIVYVPTAAIGDQVPRAPGGIRNAVNKVLTSGGTCVDEAMLIPKQYLNSTVNAGQFIVIVPLNIWERLPRATYVCLTETEVNSLLMGSVANSIIKKLRRHKGLDKNPNL